MKRLNSPTLGPNLPPSLFLSAPDYCLSPREKEVLACLVEGDLIKMIAARLFIGENTVKSHLQSLYAKLGVESGKAAIRKALIEGLV